MAAKRFTVLAMVSLLLVSAVLAEDKVDLSELKDKKSIFDPDYEGKEEAKQGQDKPTTSPEGPPPKEEEKKTAKGAWIDALKLVDVNEHTVYGQWERKGTALHGSGAPKPNENPRVMVPITLQGSYELRIRLTRLSGIKGIRITLPTGQSSVTVSLSCGFGKKHHGLGTIDGKGLAENETTVRPGTLVNGKEYLLGIGVLVGAEKAKITVDLDGRTIIRWEGPQSSLSPGKASHLPNPKCPGLSASSPTVFKEVKLRMFSGEARILSDKAPAETAAKIEPDVDLTDTKQSLPPEPRKPLTDEEKAGARSDYKTFFGGEGKEVSSSRDTRDDAAFAAKLLKAAEAMVDSPALQVLLYEKASEFGARNPAGFGDALQAIGRLEKALPDRAPECQQKRFEILKLRYGGSTGEERKAAGTPYLNALLRLADVRMGEGRLTEARKLYGEATTVARYIKSPRTGEIENGMRQLAALLAVERRRETLQSKLTRSPSDVETREALILLHVVERDSPGEARKLLDPHVSEVLQQKVSLAVKPAGKLTEPDCLELAGWYESLVRRASPAAKRRMLLRAQSYYRRFLELHTKKDALAYRANTQLRQIEEKLIGLGDALAAGQKTGVQGQDAKEEWIDVLKLADVKKHVLHGRWVREGSYLHSLNTIELATAAVPRVLIPLSPLGSYEIDAVFVRKSGRYSVVFILPVGQSNVCVNLSYGPKEVHGLTMVNGRVNNETTRFVGKLSNGEEHRVYVRVLVKGGEAEITANLDGKEVLRWQGKQSSLSVSDKRRLPDVRQIGLAARSPTIFKKVRLRMLSGEARALPDPKETPSTEGLLDPRKFARVRVTLGSDSRIERAELRDGVMAYINRNYRWKEIPKQVAGWGFTRKAGKAQPVIVVEAVRTGNVFVAASYVGKPGLLADGWLDTGLSWTCTTPGKESVMYVLCKHLSKGTKVKLPQEGFSGTMAVVPPN